MFSGSDLASWSPRRIIHDRAAEFLAEVLQETPHIMGISQLPTSGGHPQTNGLVECINRTPRQILCKLLVIKVGIGTNY